MKIWKKLMVVGVALVLVSTVFAAQYVSVETNTTLDIDTQTAGLQIGAGDPSVSDKTYGEGNQNYTLEYDSSNGNFRLNLGTWGAQNKFTSTSAFFIANANPEGVYITDVEASGTDSGELGSSVNVTLHGDQHGKTLSGTYINATDIDSSDYVHLTGVNSAYETTGKLKINSSDSNDVDTNATLEHYIEGDSNSEHWHLDPSVTMGGFIVGDTSNTNACWVRVEVSPSVSISDLTLTFHTESSVQ